MKKINEGSCEPVELNIKHKKTYQKMSSDRFLYYLKVHLLHFLNKRLYLFKCF